MCADRSEDGGSAADCAPERGVEHKYDGYRHQPPDGDILGRECRGRADRDQDSGGCEPVVTDDEVPPEATEGNDKAHRAAFAVHLKAGQLNRSVLSQIGYAPSDGGTG